MAVRFNINNPDSCQRAYLNYHCYGNTMNISPSDMGAILARWGDKVESWEKSATTNDQVDYEFDNSDFEKYKKDSFQNAETKYDNGVNIGVEHARGTSEVLWSGTSLALGTSLTKNVVDNAKDKATEAANETLTKKTKTGKFFEKINNKTEKHDFSWGVIAACLMVGATGLAYHLKKPNEDEMDAVKELNEEMGVAQSELMTQQEEMAKTQEEITKLVCEADLANEETNAFVAEQEATQQLKLSTINSIKTKQESGAKLTASERSLYKESVTLLTESNTAQANAATEAQDEVAGIYSDIETKQGVYDSTAQTIGEKQGLTDYAESIDVATAHSCGMEATAQGLNVISATKSATKAFKLAACSGWFGIAYGVAGAAAVLGGVRSAFGVIEQGKGLVDATKEISNRKNTQDLNSSTLEIYTQEIDAFAGSLGYIEDLDYEIPELDDTSGMVLAADKPEEPEEERKKKTEDETI